MNINQFFSHILCVNLDRRPERWERTRAHLEALGIQGVERFSAVDGRDVVPENWEWPPGVYGCLQSHLQLVRRARDEDWPNVLIFEDDVILDPQIQERFTQSISALPQDWAMLFFGADHWNKPEPVARDIHRITQSYSTFAFALNASVYEAFIQLNTQKPAPVDRNNWELQARFPCYGFMPHLAWVEDGFSDTQDLPFNPWWIAQSLVAKGPETDKLLAKTLAVFPHVGQSPSSRATRNLRFILNCYHHLENLEMVVVEQGPSALTNERPPGVRVLSLSPTEPADRASCFRAAVKAYGENKTYLALLDNRHVVASDQFRACLAMCHTHPLVSGHGRILDLSEEDSQHITQVNPAGVHLGAYPPLPSSLEDHGCFFIRSDTYGKVAEQDLNHIISKVKRFDPPGLALRFHQDS